MPELYNENQYYMYNGKPLLRQQNTICYGSMADKYVLFLLIVSETTVDGENGEKIKVPENIIVQILNTDTTQPLYSRIARQTQKVGLYDAMDIGVAWLDSMNK